MEGYCLECKKLYEDPREAFAECPEGHELKHENRCITCGLKIYFQTDDDFCGPGEIVCENCINLIER